MAEITEIQQLSQPQGEDSYKLDFSSQTLTYSNLTQIANFMGGREIECLNLSDTGITDKGAEILSDGIKTCTALRRCDLSHNLISDTGAKALAPRIRETGADFSLYHNQIGPEGGEALVDAWAQDRSTTRVDLSNNRLGDKGARRIAETLGQHAGRIRHLDLQKNGITMTGDRHLTTHLPRKIEVTYRYERIPFGVYSDRHPYMTSFLLLLFFPLFPLYIFLPFMKFDEPIKGLVTREYSAHPSKDSSLLDKFVRKSLLTFNSI